MMMKTVIATLCLIGCSSVPGKAQELGLWEGHQDIGSKLNPGGAEFDSATGEYKVTGGGANIWNYADAFHFVWKKMQGDLAITADVHFVGEGKNTRRKATLMVRQDLDPGSAYADVVLHGDGLSSLQFRTLHGGLSLELRSRVKGAVRIRLERRGVNFTMFAGNPGEELKPLGPSMVAMADPVYVGLAVCAHDANSLETAVFSNVTIEPLAPLAPAPALVRSKITIYSLKDKSTKVIYTAGPIFEAPNWSPDGKYLLLNSAGRLYKLPAESSGAEPQPVELGQITGCNNDHGISPDGKTIALSAKTSGAAGSQVYLAGSDGSKPRLMTPAAPSYYHGWSPDGKWLAFTAERAGNFDIFRVPVAGGPEERLTSSPGYDDGPDYSPDGKWIYINSDRSGQFQIWRLPAEGAGPGDQRAERVTEDGREDWFPHPSPDGKWLSYLSFEKGTKGHPANQNVKLELLPLGQKSAKAEVLADLFGGQGTMNVNSWAPDSQRFAFVTYELWAGQQSPAK